MHFYSIIVRTENLTRFSWLYTGADNERIQYLLQRIFPGNPLPVGTATPNTSGPENIPHRFGPETYRLGGIIKKFSAK